MTLIRPDRIPDLTGFHPWPEAKTQNSPITHKLLSQNRNTVSLIVSFFFSWMIIFCTRCLILVSSVFSAIMWPRQMLQRIFERSNIAPRCWVLSNSVISLDCKMKRAVDLSTKPHWGWGSKSNSFMQLAFSILFCNHHLCLFKPFLFLNISLTLNHHDHLYNHHCFYWSLIYC